MSGWLRDNWKWIVVPILLLVAAIVLFVVFGDRSDTSPFQYGEY